MKYVSLSFDDARSDTYQYAFPILKEYGLCGTVNVITDFVNHPENYNFSSGPKPMSVEQIKEWQNAGFEVACHGSTHKNTAEDVEKNIEELQNFGIDVKDIGFASPESYLTRKNISETGIDVLRRGGKISYIRTGIQVRREGLLYAFFSVIEGILHSSLMYYCLNKRNIITTKDIPEILPSAAIKDYTEVRQLTSLISKLKDDQAIILMFHSILPQTDSNYGKDHYYWSKDKFIELCKWLSSNENVTVVTTRSLLKV